MSKLLDILIFVTMLASVANASNARDTVLKKTLWKLPENKDDMDVTDFSIYYDLNTNQTIRRMMPRPWYHPGWPLRLPFATSQPCTCESYTCSCCVGFRISQFNFDRKSCSIIEYNPEDFMLTMRVTMNDENIYKTTLSAKNPPPFCIPVVIPYLPPGLVDFCIRLYDIAIQEQKLHMCMDWDTRVDKAPVLVLHFDCMDMGLDGVSLSKPSGAGSSDQNTGTNATSSAPSSTSTAEPEQVDSDIYDPVTETKASPTESPFTNYVKYDTIELDDRNIFTWLNAGTITKLMEHYFVKSAAKFSSGFNINFVIVMGFRKIISQSISFAGSIFLWTDVEFESKASNARYTVLKKTLWKLPENKDDMDVTDFSIYYDLNTNQTIRRMMPRPWYHPGWPLRLPFATSQPCTCESYTCSCCVGFRISQFNFDRKSCSIIEYNPEDFMLTMRVTMNDENIYKTTLSAKNPPPFCIPVVIPYLPPGLVDFCIRLYDIAIQEQKLHMCMDWDTRVDKAPVLVLHFDCMDMGLDGVSLSKPSGAGSSDQNTGTNATSSAPSSTSTAEPEQVDSDIYDPVTETKASPTESPFTNYVKYV